MKAFTLAQIDIRRQVDRNVELQGLTQIGTQALFRVYALLAPVNRVSVHNGQVTSSVWSQLVRAERGMTRTG